MSFQFQEEEEEVAAKNQEMSGANMKSDTLREGWKKVRENNAVSLQKEGLEMPKDVDSCVIYGEIPGVQAGFQLSEAFTTEQCDDYIRAAEMLGFDNASHPKFQDQKVDKMEEQYRKNDRVVYESSKEEAQLIATLLRRFIPKQIVLGNKVYQWIGVNHIFRFYRYVSPNQSFPIHRDNSFHITPNQMSCFTILIYLTTNEDGGATCFYDEQSNLITKVKSEAGKMVVFSQIMPTSPLHSGEPVLRENEAKYVLRTDAMYAC